MRWFIGFVLLLLVGCESADLATPTPLPPLEVVEAPRYAVERGRIAETLNFAGRTTPTIEEPIFFAVDGTVTEVLVNAGATVAEGEEIARLAIGALTQQLEEAELGLKSAETTRDQALATAQRNLTDTQLRLQQAQLTTNDGAVVAAEIALEGADTDTGRRLAEARLGDARNEAAAQGLVVAQLSADVIAIEAEIELLKSADTIEIEQAALTIRQLEQAIAERTLVAPFAGTLQSLDVRPGDEVEAFDPIALVVDAGEVDISAELSFDDINRLSVGQSVTVNFTNRDQTFDGEITQLPSFGSTDSRVRVAILNPPPDLQQSELAEMTVLLAESANALLLPSAAVRDFQGRTFVVIENADVQLGLTDGERVELTAGVEGGESVVGE